MKTLVTGATGFIGANLVRTFLKRGDEVHILTRECSDKWRLQEVLCDLNEHCVDLLDYCKLHKTVNLIKPDVILHSAVYGGYPFQTDPTRIMETNLIGTMNLVKACSKVDYEAFINTSTSSEYGIKNKPMSEKDLLEPLSDYGVSKAASTLFCRARALTENKNIVTLRLFSPYGPYEEPSRLIPSVIGACMSGVSPKLSSASSVRDFIYIDDVMDAYLKALKGGICSEIFNIGYGKQHSVGEVVSLIKEITSANVSPEWGKAERRPNEPVMWQADVSKARNLLNWRPKYSLREGLRRTIEWMKKNRERYAPAP